MQRIKSDAELYAVLSKRCMATDDEDTATEEPSATDEPSTEMKDLVQDITSTFGDSSKGRRKPRYQSSDDSEVHPIEERDDEDEEEEEEEDGDAPTRRSRRIAKADAGRQARQRARKWSESEDSAEEDEETR